MELISENNFFKWGVELAAVRSSSTFPLVYPMVSDRYGNL